MLILIEIQKYEKIHQKKEMKLEKEVKRVSNTQASQLVSYATTDRAVACLASQSGTGCGISKPLWSLTIYTLFVHHVLLLCIFMYQIYSLFHMCDTHHIFHSNPILLISSPYIVTNMYCLTIYYLAIWWILLFEEKMNKIYWWNE